MAVPATQQGTWAQDTLVSASDRTPACYTRSGGDGRGYDPHIQARGAVARLGAPSWPAVTHSQTGGAPLPVGPVSRHEDGNSAAEGTAWGLARYRTLAPHAAGEQRGQGTGQVVGTREGDHTPVWFGRGAARDGRGRVPPAHQPAWTPDGVGVTFIPHRGCEHPKPLTGTRESLSL